MYMKIGLCENKHGQPITEERSWLDFVYLLYEMSQTDITGVDKEECKAKAMGITACAFGGDGRRLKENAQESYFVWIDCEEGPDNDLARAVDGLTGLGLECVAYTSAGHKPPKDRFRIIVPMGSPLVDAVEYRRVWEYLIGVLSLVPGAGVDAGKKAPYNLLFQPARYSSAATNEFIYQPGAILGAAEWLSLCPPVPVVVPPETIPLDPAKVGSAYVQKVIEGELARIEASTPTNRHDTVLKVAGNLAGFAKAGLLDWWEIRPAILSAGVGKVGTGRTDEINKAIDYAYDKAKPREIRSKIKIGDLVKQEWLIEYAMSRNVDALVSRIIKTATRRRLLITSEQIIKYIEEISK